MGEKSIHTLVKDIQDVIDGKGGWDETVSQFCADGLKDILDSRLSDKRQEYTPTLRLSAMGAPCRRKLWYQINEPNEGETLPTSARFKFLYGDILEQLLISLAIAAGHRVEGTQDRLEVDGIVGHRDCVIDGITVDVKSASTYGYKKFAEGSLRSDDPFGYISQLSSYVFAGRTHEVDSHPSLGAFLVVDKQNGHICLDLYDFGPELDKKEEEMQEVRRAVEAKEPPERAFEPVADGKSGNKKLPINCSYCEMKHKCWEGLRTFLYSGKPVFLTEVVREPRVQEVT